MWVLIWLKVNKNLNILGKIIQINPILYKNLFVKFSFILGYSSEIKLKPNSEKNDELNTFYPKTNIFYYIDVFFNYVILDVLINCFSKIF